MNMTTYVGLDEDINGGLTHLGRIVLDGRVFGIIPDAEACTGWDAARLQNLYEQVYAAWEPYAHLPSRLPEPLRSRHAEAYGAVVAQARDAGWDPELGEDD
nr:hypothetical protein [Ferriphaselus sp. R-1]